MDCLGGGKVDAVNELFVRIHCCLNEVILMRCMGEFKGFGISSMKLLILTKINARAAFLREVV